MCVPLTFGESDLLNRRWNEVLIVNRMLNAEKMKVAADKETDLLENTFKTAASGISEYNRKVIENVRSTANANFDHVIALFGAKSLSEAIELSTAHARKQFEAVAKQTKGLPN